MGGMASLGSFAGGLAGRFNTSENDKAHRQYLGARFRTHTTTGVFDKVAS